MSLEDERAVAQKYIGGFPWFMVMWGLGGVFLWLALWPLASQGYIPLWLGGVFSTVILCYSYLPSHEAQHGNIGRPNTRWRWLNEFIGHTSMFAMLIPYTLHRAVHLKHHAYTNDPVKDPDMYIKADTIQGALRAIWDSKQPGQNGGIQPNVLDDNPAKERLLWEAFLGMRLAWIAMAVLAWSGFALELLVLWWIPRQIANFYIPLTLSWAPHMPMDETGRYRDTRGWKSPVGTILSAGMEYHLVHHLFPAIPLNKTPAAYRELKPLLQAEGMSLNDL